jgi:hypothetical protein
MNELEQLKKLVLDRGWDDESQQYVSKLESELHDLSVREKLAESAVIQPFIKYLTDEMDRCELLLKTDKNLNETARLELFAILKIASRFTYVFNGQAKASIESEIKRLLNVVQDNHEALSS